MILSMPDFYCKLRNMIFILLLGILPLTTATPQVQCTSMVASEVKVRVFPDIKAYQSNKISFDATNSDFKGNFVRIKNISSTLDKNFFVTYDSDYAIRLMLENTGIVHISPGSFLELFCLESLDLQNNRISEIESGAFEGLAHLRYLNLSSNLINSLAPDVFDNMTHLKSLDLSYNKIQTFNCTLRNMGWLTHLNLTHNHLTILSFADWNLPKLHFVDASQNDIKRVRAFSLYQYEELSRIMLDNNVLKKMDIFAIQKMAPKLAQITLEDNPWDCDVLFSMIRALTHSNIAYGHYNSTPDHVKEIKCSNYASTVESSEDASTESNKFTSAEPQKSSSPKISSTTLTPETRFANAAKLEMSNKEVLEAISGLRSVVLFLFAILVIFMIFEIVVRTGVLERFAQHFRRGDEVLFDNGSVENIRLLPSSNRL